MIKSFVIKISPEGKRESRSYAIKGKWSNKKDGWTTKQTKDNKQKAYEAEIIPELKKFSPHSPIESPVILGVKAFVRMPKYISSVPWKNQAAELGLIRPAKKPDFSNLLKCIEDCMTQAEFWKDDSQVINYTEDSGKYYSMNPRWEIKIIEFHNIANKKEFLQIQENIQ